MIYKADPAIFVKTETMDLTLDDDGVHDKDTIYEPREGFPTLIAQFWRVARFLFFDISIFEEPETKISA